MPEAVKDPASLENLHDIVTPGPVPWWPPATGWYVLGALVLVAAILSVIKVVAIRRKNRYRREALVQLARIQQSSQAAEGRPAAIAELAELLKRVALAAWPRERVVRLSGQRWRQFLRETVCNRMTSGDAAQVLCDVAYCRRKSEELSSAQLEQLLKAAAEWISKHDATDSGVEQPQESNR